MKYGSKSRYVILGVVLLLLMAALIYQLSNVTLAAGAEYAEQAAIKATSTIDVEGTRGRILDRNGVVLAYSKVAITWSSCGMGTTGRIMTAPPIPKP